MELRQIIKRYRDRQRVLDTDAITIRLHIHRSVALSSRVKAHADGTEWYMIKPVGARCIRMIHLCYAKPDGEGCLPLPLSKLEARPKRQVKRRSTTNRSKVMQACRSLIVDQIAAYREKFWAEYFATVHDAIANNEPVPIKPRCPLSGKSLWSNKTHVDHVYPFVRMVEDWAATIGVDLDDILVKNSRALKRLTMGETLDDSWVAYHKEHAQLRLVEAKANMSKGAKQEG